MAKPFLPAASLIFDGHAWMRSLRMPHHTIASLRAMRVGDQLVMLDVLGPPLVQGGEPSSASIDFERGRGHWSYSAQWLLHIGKGNPTRSHLMTWGKFKLHQGAQIELLPDCARGGDDALVLASARLLQRICRLAQRAARMAEAAGDRSAMVSLWPYPHQQWHGAVHVPFLDSIAAPAYRLRDNTED